MCFPFSLFARVPKDPLALLDLLVPEECLYVYHGQSGIISSHYKQKLALIVYLQFFSQYSLTNKG